jgi:DNA-binding MarR family transcriptional regulator
VQDSIDRHVARWTQELDWLDPVGEAIVGRIGLLARHTAAGRRAALADGALRHGHFKVLLTLRRLGPPYTASPSRLAELLGLTRGALSARLEPIEQAGLIRRTPDVDDRRRVHVALSDAGHAAFERQASAEQHGEHELLAALTTDERRQLADLLRTLVLSVERRSAVVGDGGAT